MSPGNWEAGERGLACIPGREAEFRSRFRIALEYADALHCARIHVMAGLVPQGADGPAYHAAYIGNLQWAAHEAANTGRDVLIEPINTRDMPGYFLNRQDAAHGVLSDVGADNVKVQMDLYHCQIVEGDLASKLRPVFAASWAAHCKLPM